MVSSYVRYNRMNDKATQQIRLQLGNWATTGISNLRYCAIDELDRVPEQGK